MLVGAVPPLYAENRENPGGSPLSVFDDIRAGRLADRSQFFKDLAHPFTYNKPDAKSSQGVRDAFPAAGNAGIHCRSIRPHQSLFRDGLHRRSQEDYAALILRVDADQIVPAEDSAPVCEPIKNSTLKIDPGAPHAVVHHAGGQGKCRPSRIPGGPIERRCKYRMARLSTSGGEGLVPPDVLVQQYAKSVLEERSSKRGIQ